ncbi:hypothetical protein CKO40_14575 [Halochromatium glycolicum]|uniref:Uncharacterized protein n=1 Tax=Halochromatium glycolicum TaxID=85075 RepID=A0AAJ0U5N6_9GAMM|nr:hypothetical protein [Halochromatium glycolicum]
MRAIHSGYAVALFGLIEQLKPPSRGYGGRKIDHRQGWRPIKTPACLTQALISQAAEPTQLSFSGAGFRNAVKMTASHR